MGLGDASTPTTPIMLCLNLVIGGLEPEREPTKKDSFQLPRCVHAVHARDASCVNDGRFVVDNTTVKKKASRNDNYR